MLQSWKKAHDCLQITELNTMTCKVCVSQKEKILLLKTPSSTIAFINGSTNFKLSAMKEHGSSEANRTGVDDAKHENAIAVSESLAPKHVVHEIPENSAIASGLQKMEVKERSRLKKLVEITHFIALKGRPFTDFTNHIELEKLHEVKFNTGTYENESECRDFINGIASYFFNKNLLNKLKRVNFIAILVDGTTDQAVKEQEVLYIMFVDPDTHKPRLAFFEVLQMNVFDQSAGGMRDAIKAPFKRNRLSNLLDKIIYSSADGAYSRSPGL